MTFLPNGVGRTCVLLDRRRRDWQTPVRTTQRIYRSKCLILEFSHAEAERIQMSASGCLLPDTNAACARIVSRIRSLNRSENSRRG